MKNIDYPADEVKQRLEENYQNNGYYSGYRFDKPKKKRLKVLLIEYNQLNNMNGIQLNFLLITELLKLLTGNNIDKNTTKPLSPMLRQEVRNAEKINKEYLLLTENDIHSVEELSLFIEQKAEQITYLETQRQSKYNLARRANEGEKQELYAQARVLTNVITPLRKEKKIAESALEKVAYLEELLKIERAMEENIRINERER